ncbi:plasmid replication initiator TrfA [Undibacterium sp. GrIS 1.8]|uniref:plasmid replication initiator TrfA n=1 Tax=Undibacterium sp. GrIS 1.8 TaxID=3143934 RepID=UPI003391EFCA
MSVPNQFHSEKKTADLLLFVEQMWTKAKQRDEREPLPRTLTHKNVVQLPFWPEVARGVPNVALRSALFGAIKKGARAYLERREIHAQEGIRIVYTGARLDQGDLDVWETILHTVRLQALGDECRVTAYQLLKVMGKTDTGINRDTLDRRVSRMKATSLNVTVGRYGYEGSLIDEVFRDKETRQYIIRLNPKLNALFAADQFTQVDWTVRQALDGKPLAQWLHGFYASHAKPFPMKVETLHKLCGSEGELRRFRQTLGDALSDVVAASVANGQKFCFEMINDLVHIKKKGSATQQRHLANNAKPHRRGP